MRFPSWKSRDRGSLKRTLARASVFRPLSLYICKTLPGSRTKVVRNLHLIPSHSETVAGQNHTVATFVHQVFCVLPMRCEISAFNGRAIDEDAPNIVIGDLDNESEERVGDRKHSTNLQRSKRSEIYRWRFTAAVVEHIVFRYNDWGGIT